MTWLSYLLEQYGRAQDQAEALDAYREGQTNLAYLLVDLEDLRVSTNRKEFQDYGHYAQSVEKLTKECAAYAIILSSALADCKTTLNLSVKQWQEQLQSIWHPGANVLFCFGVDPAFPVDDGYAEKAKDYNQYATWVEPLLAGTIAAALLFALCLVWMTAAAGRQPQDEELHLSFLDKWDVEWFAAGILAMFTFGAWLAGRWEWERRIFLAACLSAGAACGFLVFYLSIVRRVKAKMLWQTMFLRRVAWWVQSFWQLLLACTPRMLKATVSVCGFFLLMLLLYFYGGWELYTVLLLVCCLLFLAYALKRIQGEDRIARGVRRIADGEMRYQIETADLVGEQRQIAESINRIGEGLDAAVESSVKNERTKTELITNVSHDIKTPLTSILNYVDLLKRENIDDPKVRGYIDVLEKKANRLKTLTEDVVEASKISTGNITLEMADLDFVELIRQVMGEFREKFAQNDLTLVEELPPGAVPIHADGRGMWRILENLCNNAAKYAMPKTRVYVDLAAEGGQAVCSVKNISAQPLNFSADELTERFIRGDVARNTEGSGLGLSIAKSLTELQGGTFQIVVDGDLFRVSLRFPMVHPA